MHRFKASQQQANDQMLAGEFKTANELFSQSWSEYATARNELFEQTGDVSDFDSQHPPTEAFWLLMNGGNAAYLAADFESAYNISITAFDLFKDIGLIAGNPFFHLRAGQSAFEISTEEERQEQQHPATDNLARALICGGIELFRGEAPKYENHVLGLLKPPKGFASWQDTKMEGCSLHKLNESTGFIRRQVVEKYGVEPPYEEPSDG